jgi:STE24 endopeptidase
MDLLMNLSSKTELPWTPRYTQKSDEVPSDDPLEYWALALTITFTVLVYAFEGYLDGRQKRAYQVTTFPSQLSTTVTKIDAQHDEQTALLPQLQEKFSSSQNYGLDKISFAMISSAYDTFETIVFLLLGFLPYTWDKSVDVSHQYFGWTLEDEIKISLVFLAIITMVGTITSLPFEIYSTFFIEKKHGFNKQTPALFVTDKLKGLLLTFVIGGPFVALLLKIIKWGGTHFYLYAWAFMFVFSVIMMTLVPVLIMPMFNKYEPLVDGSLKTQIYALADRLEYPLTKLFVMDGSKRSSHSNAFMFGFGNNKRIGEYTKRDIIVVLFNLRLFLYFMTHLMYSPNIYVQFSLIHCWNKYTTMKFLPFSDMNLVIGSSGIP